LRSKRIAIINGWSYGAACTEALPRLHTSVTKTVESGLQMLLHQPMSILFASNRLRHRSGQPGDEGAGQVAGARAADRSAERVTCILMLKPRPVAGLATQFDRVLEAMKARGELSRHARKYALPLPYAHFISAHD
jgi:polar amino acid transport system substrate-binding protein